MKTPEAKIPHIRCIGDLQSLDFIVFYLCKLNIFWVNPSQIWNLSAHISLSRAFVHMYVCMCICIYVRMCFDEWFNKSS